MTMHSRWIFADALQIVGVDVFDRHVTGLQQFHKLPWDLNTSFRNAPAEFVRPDKFDMINSRFLTDGINFDRWLSLILEYKQLLRPGGWLQMAEIRWTFRSHSDHDLPNLTLWSNTHREALLAMQKDPDVTERRLEWYPRRVGFEHVEEQIHNVPVGSWRPGGYLTRIACECSSAD